MNKPIIAITMGDGGGIGPELIVKVLSQPSVFDSCQPFVVGDSRVMQDACQMVGLDPQVHPIDALVDAQFAWPHIDVLQPEGISVFNKPRGKVEANMGRAAGIFLQTAFELARDGPVQGVVSAPINKEAFHLAGYHYRDELAYLADITGCPDSYIIGVVDKVWTITLTEHVAFREIHGLISKARVLEQIMRLKEVLAAAYETEPRIGVAALNPHAGEGGLLGHEEIDEIIPAVREAQALGVAAHGPVPADTVFVRAFSGEFDGVVCMYHDQANIARKLQPREKGATLFMGLPVVCGTTAHGTAFDISWQGISDPGSMAAALEYVIRLSSPRES